MGVTTVLFVTRGQQFALGEEPVPAANGINPNKTGGKYPSSRYLHRKCCSASSTTLQRFDQGVVRSDQIYITDP